MQASKQAGTCPRVDGLALRGQGSPTPWPAPTACQPPSPHLLIHPFTTFLVHLLQLAGPSIDYINWQASGRAVRPPGLRCRAPPPLACAWAGGRAGGRVGRSHPAAASPDHPGILLRQLLLLATGRECERHSPCSSSLPLPAQCCPQAVYAQHPGGPPAGPCLCPMQPRLPASSMPVPGLTRLQVYAELEPPHSTADQVCTWRTVSLGFT